MNQIAQNEKDGDVVAQKKEMKLADEEDFGNDFMGKWRSWLWNTMGIDIYKGLKLRNIFYCIVFQSILGQAKLHGILQHDMCP